MLMIHTIKLCGLCYIYLQYKEFRMISKYNNTNQNIEIYENYVLLKIEDIYLKKYFLSEIREIFFNIDEEGYYFRVIANRQLAFDYEYDTKYRINNQNTLIKKVQNKEIKLIPNFGIDVLGEGIIKYCENKKKCFLFIARLKNKLISNKKLFAINYGNISRDLYKVISDDLKNFNLEKELLKCHNNLEFSKQSRNFFSKGIFLLDKSLTMGMGYAITVIKAMPHNESFQDFSLDIFYSFDEKEIKNKIIELLSSTYTMEASGYV